MRINILHVCGHGEVSGGFRVFADYAAALQARGHEVTLVSPPLARVPLFGGPIGRRLPRRRPRADDALIAGRGLDARVLKTQRAVTASDLPDADVTVATFWPTVPWVADLPPSKGAKAHFVQGEDPVGQEGAATHEDALAAFRVPMPKLAVSGWLRDRLIEGYGIDPGLIRLVFNGIDTDRFAGARPGPPAAPSVGVLWAGGDKRAELAVLAVRRLREAGQPVRLVGFGKKEPSPEHADAFDAFEQSPSQARIAGIYAGCTAWAFTSRREGFGLPILEAMAAGTPVVATRAGAAPDLVDGANGRLVDGTPEAMAAGLSAVLALPGDAWAAASRAARATAEANTLTAAADRFEAALTAIADA